MNEKDQTEYTYKAEKRRDDESSTTLPGPPDRPRSPFRTANEQLRALALTGTPDASGPVSDRIRLGQSAKPTE